MTIMKMKKSVLDKPWIFYAGVLIALLPIMIFRDFTPDNELRYISIVDEAIRNRDFFAFHNHGIPYADKPPLYFWFLMLCRLIAGGHCMWLAAMGSLLPAFGVIAVMDRWTSSQHRAGALQGAGPLSRLVLMTSGYFLGAAVILRMDMLMCFFIVLAFHTFWKMYTGTGRKRDKWLFPVYLFLALFTKGPLGILIPLFSILVFLAVRKEIRLFPRFWGWRTWGVLLALCALWFFGVYADGGKEYLNNLLFHQTIDRAVDSFHHKRPFYYYLIAMWYIIAPWSLYVIGAMVADLRKPSKLPQIQQFFIAISLTTLVLLSCISSKLQIYFLPAIPFMVYSSMMSLPKYKNNLWTKLALEFPAMVLILSSVILLALVICNVPMGLDVDIPWDILFPVISVGGALSLISLLKNKLTESIKILAMTVLSAVFAIGLLMPDLNEDMGYGAVCSKAKEISNETGIEKIYTWRIKRSENMDVYLGKDVIILDGDSVPDCMQLGKSILLTRKTDENDLSGVKSADVGKYAIIINE